jgi:hypothetical protein
MAPWVQALAFLPLALVGRLRRIERRAIARMTAGGANLAERAILLPNGGALSAFVYRRLTSAGALVPVGNDRYYLNQSAYDAFRQRRRRRAIVVMIAVVVLIAALYWRQVQNGPN